VIFANRLGRLRYRRRRAYAALADLEVAALITRLQFAVQPEFHAHSLAAHARLRLGTRDLVTVAGKRERVVVADDPLLHVAQYRGQFQLRR
jgi:hypothetical protein